MIDIMFKYMLFIIKKIISILNQNIINILIYSAYYFPSIKSKKNPPVQPEKKKEKPITRIKLRFLTPNHQNRQTTHNDSFLMKSDSSFTDDANINNISAYKKIDESYLADESMKTSNLKKNFRICLPPRKQSKKQ